MKFRLWLLLLFFGLALFALAQEELQVEVKESGMGPAIENSQIAVVAYTLTLDSGLLIEKSSVRNPFRFELGSPNTIPGFSQGVEGMKVGETRLIRIPPSLGYGERDMGSIPANSTLVFEVELLEIEDPLSDKIDEVRPSDLEEDLDLKEAFKDETVLNRRHAQDITKPAMFEYLIRDFFTKPWRYEDGHLKIWRSTGNLLLVFVFILGFAWFGGKRGYWIL